MTRLAGLVVRSDISLFYLFQKIHCFLLDLLMKTVTHLGSTVFSISITLYFLIYGKYQTGTDLVVVLIISQCIVQLMKRIIHRPRPYNILSNVIAINPPSCKYSFPSGHTCAAFTIAFILAASFPMLAFPLFIVAFLVGISRIYLGVHYPTDVVIGFLIAKSSWMFTSYFF